MTNGVISIIVCAYAAGCAAASAPAAPAITAVARNAEPAHAVQAPPPASELTPTGPGLSSEQVADVVRGRSLAVGGCHAVEFSGSEPLAGFVVLDLTINSGGKVMHAYVSESSYTRQTLTDCVVSVARGLTFPQASGSTEISWRFDFRGRQSTHY